MIRLGLTGSIGMGKSTTAAMFREAGIPVYDADAAVADLYLKGGAAVAPLEAAFPGVTKDGAVDREALRQRVLGDDAAMARLNSVVHPLLGQDRVDFFAKAEAAKADMVVLDIPLLGPCARPGGHDPRTAGRHPRPPDGRRREARPGPFRGGHRPRPRRRPGTGGGDHRGDARSRAAPEDGLNHQDHQDHQGTGAPCREAARLPLLNAEIAEEMLSPPRTP
jgi:dephospho-CoA kinase